MIDVYADPARSAVEAFASAGGNRLVDSGIDAWDGTPIIDIKGYYPRDDMRPDARVPHWLETLWRLHDEERGGGAGEPADGGVTGPG